MDQQIERKYVLEDIMKKRKRDRSAIQSKIKTKIALKAKRKDKKQAIHAPEKFINEYRNAQKSYAYFKRKQVKANNYQSTFSKQPCFNKLLLVIRIRGVKDISKQQKAILNKFNLRTVNSAVFVKANKATLKQLKTIENYITYGQPKKKIINELIYRKMWVKEGQQRVQIKSNEQVQKYIGGDVICLEDVVNEITTIGPNFNKIIQSIYPFKLTTAEGTLASRLRKPVTDGGFWGYRGEQINELVGSMI